MMGNIENAGFQHFLLFPHCFQKPSLSRSIKVWIMWYGVNTMKYNSERGMLQIGKKGLKENNIKWE